MHLVKNRDRFNCICFVGHDAGFEIDEVGNLDSRGVWTLGRADAIGDYWYNRAYEAGGLAGLRNSTDAVFQSNGMVGPVMEWCYDR